MLRQCKVEGYADLGNIVHTNNWRAAGCNFYDELSNQLIASNP